MCMLLVTSLSLLFRNPALPCWPVQDKIGNNLAASIQLNLTECLHDAMKTPLHPASRVQKHCK